MRKFPSYWIFPSLLLVPMALAGGLTRLEAARARSFVPVQSIIVPKLQPIGLTPAAVAFSPDSQKLAMADTQGQLRIWNIKQKRFERHFPHRSGDTARSLGWGAKQQLSVGDGDSVDIFAMPAGSLRKQIPTQRKQYSNQDYLDHYSQSVTSAKGTLAAQAQVHGAVAVWDIGTGKRRFAFKAPQRETCGVALSSDDSLLAVASLLVKPNFVTAIGTEISLRSARTGKVQRMLRWDEAGISRIMKHDGSLEEMALAFSPDSRRLAAASINGVRIWDVNSGKLLRSIKDNHSTRWGGRKWLAFSPDGALLVGIGWGDSINVWSVQRGQLLHQFKGSDYMASLAFSPDGRWLATGGQRKTGQGITQIWDAKGLG